MQGAFSFASCIFKTNAKFVESGLLKNIYFWNWCYFLSYGLGFETVSLMFLTACFPFDCCWVVLCDDSYRFFLWDFMQRKKTLESCRIGKTNKEVLRIGGMVLKPNRFVCCHINSNLTLVFSFIQCEVLYYTSILMILFCQFLTENKQQIRFDTQWAGGVAQLA